MHKLDAVQKLERAWLRRGQSRRRPRLCRSKSAARAQAWPVEYYYHNSAAVYSSLYYRSHAVPTFLLDILLVEKKTQASVHSHADLLIFLIAALSFLYTSSLRSLAPAVETAEVL